MIAPMYNRNAVFAAACLGMLLFGVVFLSLGSVNNMVAERFALDDNGIGTLTALLPIGILAGSFIFGPVVDRFGYRWMLIVCSLLVLVGLEGIAFARSTSGIKFFIFLIGFGGGVLNGATNALVADVSEGERGAKLSLLGVFFGIGALGMPAALAALSKHFSQFNIVASIGLLVLVPIIYFLIIRFPPAKQQTRAGSLGNSLRLLREPLLLCAGLMLALQSGMESLSNDWTTRYYKKVVLLTETGANAEQQALLALTVLVAAMVAMRLALGWLLKKVPSHHVVWASMASIAVGALVLLSSRSFAGALPGTLLIGAGLAAAFPVMLGYIGDLYPSNSGTAFSLIFVIALLGNMSINKTFGWFAQQHGIEHYTRAMLLCLIIFAFLFALVLKQLRKNSTTNITNEQSRKTMAR